MLENVNNFLTEIIDEDIKNGLVMMFTVLIFTFVGMAYQYGHASEVVDSVTVESDIDNFDNL